jgi:hypothetical protein
MIIPFSKISSSSLIVDAIYEGGDAGNISDDPISRLLPVHNQGGFRYRGKNTAPEVIVLYSSGHDTDWPDVLNKETGIYTYYGDNRAPGKELHDTPNKGNSILRSLFEAVLDKEKRCLIPPIFIFEKNPTEGSSRSVRFLGMAAPGDSKIGEVEQLVALWKSKEGRRFQNYKAFFSVLDISKIERSYIDSKFTDDLAPKEWLLFKNKLDYRVLRAGPTIQHRVANQQLPKTNEEWILLLEIFNYFNGNHYQFEVFAGKILPFFDSRYQIKKYTRLSADGGIDAIGEYKIGINEDEISFEFYLEAKCYNPKGLDGKISKVGVQGLSRLISRIRNRQFGILITTSVVSMQAYKEVRQDQHPIVIISGGDIASALISAGINTVDRLKIFIESLNLDER